MEKLLDKKIVLVDDNEDNLFLFTMYLQKIGYQKPTNFSQPEEVLKKLEESKAIPDLFILDVMMPNVDGISLAKQIRNEKKYDDSYIIFATAKQMDDTLADCFEAGGYDFINKPLSFVEIKYRLENLFKMQDMTRRLKCQNLELKKSSITDGLTQLSNRIYLNQRLEEEFSKCSRYQQDLSYLMLDIDFFKKVNDQYGHQVGDKVLVEVANITNKSIRNSDLAARYGGEEFAVVLPGTALSHGKDMGERIRQKIEATPIKIDNITLKITVSIGVASYDPETKTSEELIKNADTALYQAKEKGRNQVIEFLRAKK